MSHVNDLKLSALETLTGTTGHINDLTVTWLLTAVVSAVGNQINDLWRQLFLENGATSEDFNTAASEFLALLGFTSGDLNQNWYDYWSGGGGGGASALRDRSGAVIRDRDGNIINTRT
jgi:hypothetical protein